MAVDFMESPEQLAKIGLYSDPSWAKLFGTAFDAEGKAF